MTKFSIDPRVDVWISILMALVAGVGAGALPAFPGIDPGTWKLVQQWCLSIVAYATVLSPVLPALSSNKSGPAVKQ